MVGLIIANVLMFVTGVGSLSLLKIANSWRELISRYCLGYLFGIAIVAGLAAHLALIHITVGWITLLLLALIASVATMRLRGTESPRWPRVTPSIGAAAIIAVATFVEYVRAFVIHPLSAYDAWAIWTLKGRALYSFGWADPAVFAGHAYRFAHLEYPLLLPSLEAIDFRAMGTFDPELVHMQFLLILVAAIGALFVVLRDLVNSYLLGFSLLAFAAAPSLVKQLLSAYADVPMALFLATGVVAAARWLITDERWTLRAGTVFFAAALLTKLEASLFVAAALLGLVLAAQTRWRAIAWVAFVEVLALLPWRIFTTIHGLHALDYRLGDSVDLPRVVGRLDVGASAFITLGKQMTDPRQWGLVFIIFIPAIAIAWLVGARALAVYSAVFVTVSWVGLSWIYVISRIDHTYYLNVTKTRVISGIVIAVAALLPLLVAQTWQLLQAHEAGGGSREGLEGSAQAGTRTAVGAASSGPPT